MAGWAAVAVAAYGAVEAHEARNEAQFARKDAAAKAAEAEAKANQRAALQASMARKALKKNSLFTGAGDATGRTTLGV